MLDSLHIFINFYSKLPNCTHFFLVSWGGVRLSPLGTSATNWPIVPAPDDRWWWMWSSRWNENWHGNRSTQRKPALVPLCPPQIPHDLTWAWTRSAAVGSLCCGTVYCTYLLTYSLALRSYRNRDILYDACALISIICLILLSTEYSLWRLSWHLLMGIGRPIPQRYNSRRVKLNIRV
jgi:hypothetical protein